MDWCDCKRETCCFCLVINIYSCGLSEKRALAQQPEITWKPFIEGLILETGNLNSYSAVSAFLRTHGCVGTLPKLNFSSISISSDDLRGGAVVLLARRLA